MAKLCNLGDQLSELDKRVFGLQLLRDIDVSALNESEFNSWLGLLYDSVDLLWQTAADLRILYSSLSSGTQ